MSPQLGAFQEEPVWEHHPLAALSFSLLIRLCAFDPNHASFDPLRDLKFEISKKIGADPEDFQLFISEVHCSNEDQLLIEKFGKIPMSVFVAIKRHPDLEDEEFDSRFKSNVARHRIPETPSMPVNRTASPSPSSWISSYDKKSATGFAGLSNQGATCYMNSLIQGLFMTPEFRTAVYNWSFTEHLSTRVAKLRANPESRKTGKDEEDMTWVDSADELLSLFNSLEQQNGIGNTTDSETSSQDPNSAPNGTPSSTPTPSTTPSAIPETEESCDSKFISAVKAQSVHLLPHALNFEKWKRRVEAKSIPFQLRLLFANLQLSEQRAISTKGLTKSFGWTGADAFTQHDVQELLRVLFDALETAWDGTPQHSLINDLYQGTVLDYVKCSHCGYKSARCDSYLDLQLTVKPFGATTAVKSIEEALEKYVQPEQLEGDNQYSCTKCACKRDATKGLEFSAFPYLLTLQLKRFDFDWETERRIKLTDRVSFPNVLNLNKFISSSSNDDAESPKAPSAANTILNPASELLTIWSKFTCPENYSIRAAHSSDMTSILNLHRTSFESEVEGGIVEALTKALPNSHLISLVAVDQRDQVVGHLLFSAVSIYDRTSDQLIELKEANRPYGRTALSAKQLERSPKLFGLAPVAVHIMHQKKGIGSALIAAGLQQLTSWGAKAAFVLGDSKLYSRFGFTPSSNYGIGYGTPSDSDHFMALELSEGALQRAQLPSASYVKFCPLFDEALSFGERRRAADLSRKDEFADDAKESNGGAIAMEEITGPSWNQVILNAYEYRKSLKLDDEPAFSVLGASAALESTLSAGPWTYELFAIFVHRGSATGGHYFAYIKDFEKDKWFEFNDSVVSEVSEETVKGSYGDVGSFASGGSAYMLLYRQYDAKRNCKYPSASDIPAEVAEAMDKEKKRREAKERLKRIEAQKIPMSVSYRGTRKDIRIHRDQPIAEALKMAMTAFQVTASIENVRFHSTSQFLRPDEPSLWDMATPLSAFSRDNTSQVQLQVRKPGTEFADFDPRAVLYLVNVWNTETSSWPAESYEVYLPPRPELGNLRDRIASEFGIPKDLQIITKEKNTAQPIEELTGDDNRSLGQYSLWEKAVLWVEPYSDSLIDQKYRPSRRKRIGTSYTSSKSTQYKSSITSQPSVPVAASIPKQSSVSSSGEMEITPFGFEDSDEDEALSPETVESSPQNGDKKDEDDGYEDFHDPKFIFRNGQRIIPRAEDFVRNVRNRMIVRFTNLDGEDVVHSLPASKTDTVGSLRDRIAQVLKLDPNAFMILKSFSSSELNDSDATIDEVSYGSICSLRIRRGTPSLRGESLIKIESYVLDGPTGSVRKPLFEPQDWFAATEKLSVKDAKPLIRKLAGLDPSIPLDHIRIRRPGPPSSFEGLATNVESDGKRLAFLGNRILVQVLDQPEPKQNEQSKVLTLRQVFPERWELGPALELCVPAGGTFGDVRDHCAKISGLKSVQCINRAIYHVPQVSELGGLDWSSYESRLERAIGGAMSDGDFIFFKDADAAFRDLTDEEKRKLPKAKTGFTSSSYVRRAERALTIKVDDSS